MRRVLKPGGQLLFVEHGLAPEPGVRKWQEWLTPAWKRFSGGCPMDRPIQTLIDGHGFAVAQIETGYLTGRPWTPLKSALPAAKSIKRNSRTPANPGEVIKAGHHCCHLWHRGLSGTAG